MPIRSRLIHTLQIERSTPGAVDGYGQPVQTWAPISTVPGLILPKSARELALASQAGAQIGDYDVYMEPTDVSAADRIRLVPDDGRLFELLGVKPFLAHHLECDAVVVTN